MIIAGFFIRASTVSPHVALGHRRGPGGVILRYWSHRPGLAGHWYDSL
jgi:hypothetical protein